MSTTPYTTSVGLRWRHQRIYRIWYSCEACTPVGSEWSREALTLGPDWCPNCGRQHEPESYEEYEVCRPEFTDLPGNEEAAA